MILFALASDICMHRTSHRIGSSASVCVFLCGDCNSHSMCISARVASIFLLWAVWLPFRYTYIHRDHVWIVFMQEVISTVKIKGQARLTRCIIIFEHRSSSEWTANKDNSSRHGRRNDWSAAAFTFLHHSLSISRFYIEHNANSNNSHSTLIRYYFLLGLK